MVNSCCCATAELYGILLYCNTFTGKSIKIVTENVDFANRLPKLIKKAFGFAFDEQLEVGAGKKKYVFRMTNEEHIGHIFAGFGLTAKTNLSHHVNFGVLEEDCCRVSFLRGIFLAGGSVTDPSKRYHLELTTTHRKVSAEVNALLLDMSFFPKITNRNGSVILYFKQSDYIEDFLTTIGAPVCAMDIMEAKVEKDIRNVVNRRVNCDTANLTKVVDAAQDQLAAIRKLKRRKQMGSLPDKLRQTALLRQKHPEATLTELGEMMKPKVSKSAINHRMRKIIELSKE